MLSAIIPVLAIVFPLEWNANYPTDVAYEVELSPEKLGASAFVVKADGRTIPTVLFDGRLPGTVSLRFSVPSGTQSLTCESTAKAMKAPASLDNLFVAALDPENISRWELPRGVRAAAMKGGGIRFDADASADAHAEVCFTVDVDEGLPGKPVVQEIDVTSLSRLARGGNMWIDQFDESGARLPETLADLRQTSHMRPKGKTVTCRDEGRIHPKAKKLRFRMELRRLSVEHDEYGLLIKDKSLLLPSLVLSRLAVRPAAKLPFPKWNDAFFGKGVSGKPGDGSLRMGDKDGKAFFYQTHTRGTWSGAYRFRDERSLTFPSGEGTIEAWFKPDWRTFEEGLSNKTGKPLPAVLFHAYGGYSQSGWKTFVETAIEVSYEPKAKSWTVEMRDWSSRHQYRKVFASAGELPDGVWTHVALQWMPHGVADLFVAGRKIATLDIPEFEAVPLNDSKVDMITDVWAMELFFGCSAESARLEKSINPKRPLFQGWGDNLRASTGRRYSADFTPAKSFALDAATRALFSFDRSFDGLSGGGYGFVRGSIRALDDRVAHTVMVDGKPVPYWPKDIVAENHPRNVFDLNNYPVMPTDAEFRAARTSRAKSFSLGAGDVASFLCGSVAYPEFTEIVNASPTEPLVYPIPVRMGGLDPRSFGDLSDDLLSERRSDRENVNRVFQYVIASTDYFTGDVVGFKPGSDLPHEARLQALGMLNGYLGFECGPLNNLAANLFVTVAKCAASRMQGYGHEFEEVFFSGKNHIYDLSAQKFFPSMDNENSADLEEIGDQPGIHCRVGMSADHFMRKGLCGGGVQDPCYGEKCALILNSGEKVRIWYANDTRHNNLHLQRRRGETKSAPKLAPDVFDYAKIVHLSPDAKFWALRRDRMFPHFSTAIISFDGAPLAANPAFDASHADSFTYRVRSCYPIVFGEYAAYRKDGRMAPLEISTDFGRTFRPLLDGGDGIASLEYQVKARYDYLVRVKAPIGEVKRFAARTEGLVNPRTYPGWARAGKNEFRFRCEPGGKAFVTFSWREPVKDIVISGTAKTGAIPGFERELVVMDPAHPLTLNVSGASSRAKTVVHGQVSANLSDGRLTVSYDPSRAPALVHGDDIPEKPGKFPAIAAVDIVDCGAVKTLAVIVSPNSRLVFTDDVRMGEKKTVAFAPLPAGDYHVFVLGRFESNKKVEETGRIFLYDPADSGKARRRSHRICRQMSGSSTFLKAQFGKTGERANWKWDSAFYEGEYDQRTWSGYSYRSFAFPERNGTLDFYSVPVENRPMEMATVMILPKADLETRRDLRALLFGLNADPFHVK